MTGLDAAAERRRLLVERVQPAYRQVADQLRSLIVGGQLAPGDRLPSEAELSDLFGVSRSTVREALRALSSRDLVITTRGSTGGSFVAHVRPSSVADYLEASIGLMSGHHLSVEEILEARELLEVPAAGLAADRRTEQHVRRLQEALESEGEIRERGPLFTEHRHFHVVVLETAQNGLLGLMTEPVFRVLQERLTRPGLGEDVWHRVDSDHADIAERIIAGDPDGARETMRAHLRRLRDIYLA
ncbi:MULTISPECIES: FadR/GntR family transcriptional regulator [unclassified Nocardioides]|uniref:FadR/GntR family transcriptional regulator n=1 Tax=unclassified Nocardioides TaxID=2615069 RepID=UPI00005713F5|nr:MULTISPECIES: FadR/GntR family transcriptional regulator [unclassified Nocardioides]ABL83560.1 transcriptional regulator, GntR family [Nocardioides sp. JS614]